MPSPPESTGVAGLLLTGGASRRMGFDKALIRVDGETLAVRIGRRLASVAGPAFEVGPGYSDLPTAPESAPGSGPLAALSDGVAALRQAGFPGPALLVSTDLPLIDAPTLELLARWPGQHSVVPWLKAHAQPLCARWSAGDLNAVAALVAGGERSMAPLLRRPGVELVYTCGRHALPFADADTPEQLDALGLDWAAP